MSDEKEQLERVKQWLDRGGDVMTQDDAARSVFAFSLFIDQAFSEPETPPEGDWKAAVGVRPLTEAEQAARERHFEEQAKRAVERARKNQSHDSATETALQKVLAATKRGP